MWFMTPESGTPVGNWNAVLRPVGQKSPNKWGLYDMMGNTVEWVNDNFDYYLSSSTVIIDPDPMTAYAEFPSSINDAGSLKGVVKEK